MSHDEDCAPRNENVFVVVVVVVVVVVMMIMMVVEGEDERGETREVMCAMKTFKFERMAKEGACRHHGRVVVLGRRLDDGHQDVSIQFMSVQFMSVQFMSVQRERRKRNGVSTLD